ncbi:hypothetical protein [Streptomyces carpinensis]|uniref:Transposase n=1 Tax=Streptomyces carpinensis TaxID=66369 RepID=A0ABV1WKE7_9ACTN|nr:hypothetical protein [Streptomyces carpinensis]
MRRKGGRRGGEQNVEALLDELYTTPPADFVARREELTAAVRADGRAEDARLIHGARRPTLAAWAANLLLRSRPEESRQFLELGEALREAYRALDAAGLRELSAQRRQLVSALSRQAAQLAQEAGHRLSDAVRQDVESTLLAVLTDPDAAEQWAAGRLHGALTPPSVFPADAGPAEGASQKPPRPAPGPARTRTAAPPARAKDELAERRRERQATRLAAARKAAEEADQRLRARRAEQADADAAVRQARDRRDRAGQQVSAAEQQLHQAREDLRRAEHEQRAAEERLQEAAGDLARAEQEARRAAKEVDRLAARAE